MKDQKYEEFSFSDTCCGRGISSSRFAFNTFFLLWITILIVFSSGCNKKVPMVPVIGKVTFNGESPPSGGAVYFSPISVKEGLPNRPASASFGPNGHFEAQSFVPGDGLVPGTYTVRVDCWKTEPTMGAPGVSFIPDGFVAENLIVPSDEKRIEHIIDITPPE